MVETGVEQRLAGILAADVAGYTRLMADDEQATIAAITEFRGVFRGHIENNGGRVVDMAGDSVLAVFASAAGAVRAAVDAQAALAEHNAALEESRRMHFRVGVNLGDIHEHADGAVYGDGVNVAARLESLARPGGVMISEFAYQQVRRAEGMAFADAGEHEVKNVAEPVRAYRLLGKGESARPSRHPRRLVFAGLGFAVILAGAIALWQLREPAPEPTAETVSEDPVLALPSGPSIAVLPFDNLSGDPAQDYFVDGLSEQIITELTYFEDLFVIARNTTFQYKGRAADVREVGTDLGVAYVLEGSVRKAGDTIRVTAQLLDAKSGGHLWAEDYERTLTAENIFALQDDIAAKVVGVLADNYGVIARSRMSETKAKPTDSLDAYDCVLRAKAYVNAYTPELHLAARDCLERAVEIDPNYVDAWTHLAWMYMDEYWSGFNPRPDGPAPLEVARQTVQRAIDLDPDNAFALAVLSSIHYHGHELTEFVAIGERAISLNPNNAFLLLFVGQRLLYAGHWERAMALHEKARALNPHLPRASYYSYTNYYYHHREYEKALEAALSLNLPEFYWTHIVFAEIYGQLGRSAEAKQAVDELLRLYPGFTLETARKEMRFWNFTESHIEHRVEGLRKAGVPEEPPVLARPGIAVLPFDNMSGDAVQDYFADGLTETLITNLSRLDDLMVIARNSAFVFKGRAVDVREVGETLGVQYVVEGSVQIIGERVRVNAQLVDATSGGHLWAEAYDREMSDIFAVHDDISGRIVSALDITLSEGDTNRLGQIETQSVEAYDSYIRGLAELFRYTPDGNLLGRSLMRQAFEIDPSYARPYGILSLAMFLAWEFQWSQDAEILERAAVIASEGVDIDPTLASAHANLGWIRLWQKQHDRAIAALEKAVEIDGDDVWAVSLLAESLNYVGRPEEVPALFPILERIDPLYPLNDFYLGHAQYLMGDYDVGIASLNKTLTFAPNFSPAHRILAAIYVELGRMDDARAAVAEIKRISPTASVELWRERLPYRDPAVLDRLIENWEKAGLAEGPE